jgi:hypothetical protein
MTGTERAALRLVLGTLRVSLYTHTKYTGRARRAVVNALGVLPDSLADLWAAVDDLLGMPFQADLVCSRILRARLALYIRAVLRAERGEVWGGFVLRHWRPEWPEEVYAAAYPMHPPGDNNYEFVRIARPLWLDARPHR